MSIIELTEKQNIADNNNLSKIYTQLGALLKQLKTRELPGEVIASINKDIEEINASSVIGNDLKKLVKQKQTNIIKLVEKEVKIVPKNYYRNLWLPLGMCIFGAPIGIIFGSSVGNMGLIGIGFPIGMAIGIAIGSGMDRKACKEGRQLDIEIKPV